MQTDKNAKKCMNWKSNEIFNAQLSSMKMIKKCNTMEKLKERRKSRKKLYVYL